MRRPVSLLAVAAIAAVGIGAGSTGASAGAATAKCGLYPQEIDGETIYLGPITRRENISCRRAKRVSRRALRKLGGEGVVLCGEPDRFRGWTIRHVGHRFALHGRFTKDGKRFDLSSQGSC